MTAKQRRPFNSALCLKSNGECILKFNKSVTCPCCNELKSTEDTTIIQKTIHDLFLEERSWAEFFYGSDESVAYNNQTAGKDNWACDACIKKNLALAADPTEQEFCDWPPYLAYLDNVRKCETCSVEFVFSKEEQLFWFENLKFWVQSEAINCKSCRAKKRERKDIIRNAQSRLSKILPVLNKKDKSQIEEIIELYEHMGSTKRIIQYRNILKSLEFKANNNVKNT